MTGNILLIWITTCMAYCLGSFVVAEIKMKREKPTPIPKPPTNDPEFFRCLAEAYGEIVEIEALWGLDFKDTQAPQPKPLRTKGMVYGKNTALWKPPGEVVIKKATGEIVMREKIEAERQLQDRQLQHYLDQGCYVSRNEVRAQYQAAYVARKQKMLNQGGMVPRRTSSPGPR